MRRFVSIWFPFLKADYETKMNPALVSLPFVVFDVRQARMVITGLNKLAESKGIHEGMLLADARAILPGLLSKQEVPDDYKKIISGLAEWFIRFSPIVSIKSPNDLLMEATGCPHLWGGEDAYLNAILSKMKSAGFGIRISIAGSSGMAWALSHYGHEKNLLPPGQESACLSRMPVDCLEPDPESLARLYKLGLKKVGDLMALPGRAISRRFGPDLLEKLQQALGLAEEKLVPVTPSPRFMERIQCFDPVATRKGIDIALEKLLEKLCRSLRQHGLGARALLLSVYRTDDTKMTARISTNRPVADPVHLAKLFSLKSEQIDPCPGIELFILEATITEELKPEQEALWSDTTGTNNKGLADLLDRIASRIGRENIQRYLPSEHHWPERSFIIANELTEQNQSPWISVPMRPVRFLSNPEPIAVTAPVPDYPPMLFRHRNKLHKIVKADGPERIEQEWWIEEGLHRDYYYVEDENGCRYWLFRLGHYEDSGNLGWFLHGYGA